MTTHRLRRSLGLISAAALSGLIAFAAAPAASAAPEMSVTISDDVTTVKAGEALTYTTTVENMGADPVDVKVVVSVPSYLSIGDAGGGAVEKNATTWTITVAPHEKSSVKLAGKIGTIPKSEVRVTAVASVYVGDAASPLVRSADADHIQGVADTPSPRASASSSAGQQGINGWAIVIGVAAVIVLAAIITAVVVLLRRRSSSRPRRTQS